MHYEIYIRLLLSSLTHTHVHSPSRLLLLVVNGQVFWPSLHVTRTAALSPIAIFMKT